MDTPWGRNAQAWPRKRGKPKSDTTKQQNADFKRLVGVVNAIPDPDKIAARMIAEGSGYTWRDVLSRAATGNLFEPIPYPEDFVSGLLDQITSTPGALLYRGPTAWIFVPPGTDGQVLAFDITTHAPVWVNPQPLAITELTGDVLAGPGAGSQPATLAASGVAPGAYPAADIVVDAKGRVTAAAASGLTQGIRQLTGAVLAGPGGNSQVATLSATGVTAASYDFASITVTADGRITAAHTGMPPVAGGDMSYADLLDEGAFVNTNTYTAGQVVVSAGYRFLNKLALAPGGSTGWDIAYGGTHWTVSGTFNETAVWTTTAAFNVIIGVNPITSGKLYWELAIPNPSVDGGSRMGMALASHQTSSGSTASVLGTTADSVGLDCFGGTAMRWNVNNAQTYSGLLRYNANHVLAFAYDQAAKLLWVKDATAAGSWYGDGNAGDPALGTHGFDCSGITAGTLFPAFSNGGDSPGTIVLNTGQSTFVGTIPSGFSQLGGSGSVLPPPASDAAHWLKLGAN